MLPIKMQLGVALFNLLLLAGACVANLIELEAEEFRKNHQAGAKGDEDLQLIYRLMDSVQSGECPDDVGTLIHLAKEYNSGEQVNKFIVHYVEKLVPICDKKFRELIEENKEKIDEELVGKFRETFRSSREEFRQRFPNVELPYESYLTVRKSLNLRPTEQSLLRKFLELAHDKENGFEMLEKPIEVDPKQLECTYVTRKLEILDTLMNKYLSVPCRNLDKAFGETLYALDNYLDSCNRILEPIEQFGIRFASESSDELLETIYLSKICSLTFQLRDDKRRVMAQYLVDGLDNIKTPGIGGRFLNIFGCVV